MSTVIYLTNTESGKRHGPFLTKREVESFYDAHAFESFAEEKVSMSAEEADSYELEFWGI